MAKSPTSMAASVRQRLLNLARSEGRDFQTVLVAFGPERLIWRLSVSAYRDQFFLKGGMPVTLWTSDPGRFTRDVDFLGFGAPDDERIKSVFADILKIEAPDGLQFETEATAVSNSREDQVYGGKRRRTIADLAGAGIPITIDIGSGDAITAPGYEIDYGSLLDFDSARIRAYSPATVMAEKLQAVVALGLINGRMKDFYDLWPIPRAIDVPVAELGDAVRATFERRQTPVSTDRPAGLSRAFAEQQAKTAQWRAFSTSAALEGKSLEETINEIWNLIQPAFRAAIP